MEKQNWHIHSPACDGTEYEILERAVESVKDIEGLILEIGTRKGGSMMIIIDSLLRSEQENRHVISVDPYGHIPYNSGTMAGICKFDYTNDMKKKTMVDLYTYVQNKPVNLITFCMTDSEFRKRFSNGVEVYQDDPILVNKYAFAFLDGPHDTISVTNELQFICNRMTKGAKVVIDNIDFFDLDTLLAAYKKDFEVVEQGVQKICLCKL